MVKVLSSHLQQASLSEKSPYGADRCNQINGQTLHSLLRLPIDGKYRPLAETPTVLSNLQRVFNGVKYLIIDEKSMLGLKTLGWIDLRLREIFPRSSDEFFGGLSVMLIGDFFQLPPVLNKPLYQS
jgi:ATP-dependent DNA helicase PIF1